MLSKLGGLAFGAMLKLGVPDEGEGLHEHEA
jgi:hypothetical protein